MAPRKQSRSPRLDALLISWTLHLDSANRQKTTIRSYTDTVNLLCAYLSEHAMPVDAKGVQAEHLRAFFVACLHGCRPSEELAAACQCGVRANSPGNADKHFRNIKAFFNFIIKEDVGVSVHPMANLVRPTVPDKPTEIFSDQELALLFKECSGTSHADRRDTAIMAVFADTGMRVGSLVGLRYSTDPEQSDVMLTKKLLRIRKKGGSIMLVPIGKKTARDLDRYIRARANHPHADSEWLWLGQKGRLRESGVQQMLDRRGTRAGLTDVHPHRFRHTFADDWLTNGGSESDLMSIAGWKSAQMLRRYGRAAAGRRAWQAHAKLSPRDRLQ